MMRKFIWALGSLPIHIMRWIETYISGVVFPGIAAFFAWSLLSNRLIENFLWALVVWLLLISYEFFCLINDKFLPKPFRSEIHNHDGGWDFTPSRVLTSILPLFCSLPFLIMLIWMFFSGNYKNPLQAHIVLCILTVCMAIWCIRLVWIGFKKKKPSVILTPELLTIYSRTGLHRYELHNPLPDECTVRREDFSTAQGVAPNLAILEVTSQRLRAFTTYPGTGSAGRTLRRNKKLTLLSGLSTQNMVILSEITGDIEAENFKNSPLLYHFREESTR